MGHTRMVLILRRLRMRLAVTTIKVQANIRNHFVSRVSNRCRGVMLSRMRLWSFKMNSTALNIQTMQPVDLQAGLITRTLNITRLLNSILKSIASANEQIANKTENRHNRQEVSHYPKVMFRNSLSIDCSLKNEYIMT